MLQAQFHWSIKLGLNFLISTMFEPNSHQKLFQLTMWILCTIQRDEKFREA